MKLLNTYFTFFILTLLSGCLAKVSKIDESHNPLLTTPGNFTISTVIAKNEQVELTWTKADLALRYIVTYGTYSGDKSNAVSICSINTACTISGLTNSTKYYFNIDAVNAAGKVSAAEVSAIPGPTISAPLTPSDLSATGATANIQLSWTAASGLGTITYNILRSTTSGSGYTAIATGRTGTSYADLTALNGVTYYYVINATNEGGSSPNSAEVSATALGSFSISSINSNTASALQVAWASSTGATAYTVKYGTTSGSHTITASTNATSPYTISGLTAGTTYYVMVTATNTSGSVNATSEAPAIPMAAFSISSLTPALGAISLNWGSSTAATTYDILYDTATQTSSGSYANSSTNKVSGNSVSLAAGTTYYFRIRANNAYGSLLSTNELSAASYQNFTLNIPYDVGSEASYVLSNSSSLEFISGLVRLAVVDQTDSDGNSGGFLLTHSGTAWDSTNNYVRLNTTINNAELDASWAPQYSSLVGYWKLNESSGTSFVDSSPSGLTGTLTGTVNYNAGKIGNSIGFDGSTSYISVGTMGTFGANLSTGFSVSAWIKTSNTTGFVTLFGTTSTGTKMNFQASINQSCTGGSYVAGAIRFFLRDNSGVDLCHQITTNTKINDGNWHMVTYSIIPSTKTMAFYLDGISQTLVKSIDNSPSNFVNFEFPVLIGAVNNRGVPTAYHNGDIDELAVWTKALTASEVNTIYSRQMSKYAGIFTSRIIDGFGTQTWSSLSNVTTLPFSKELLGSSGSETSTNYSSMSANLMTNLVGLWHLNETSGTTITDYSGNTNTATMQGTGTLAQNGIFGNAIKGDGSTGYFSTATSFVTPLNYSLQAWFKTSTGSGGVLLSFENLQTGASSTFGRKIYMTNAGLLTYGIYTTSRVYTTSSQSYNDGQWHHVVATQSSISGMALYVDGVLVASDPATNPEVATGYWRFAHGTMSTGWTGYPTSNYFNATMDEVAIWSRAITSAEVLKLYRRGANRIKFQIRTCSTNNCSDQEALVTSGKGWKGPDNTQFTYFSELYNTTSNVLAGAVSTGSPTMTFSNFSATNLSVTNNRYFQYRSILESNDKNSLCDYGAGAATCSPELKSVDIGPVHYDSSDPTITSKTSIGSLYQLLDASGFTETLGGGSCVGARYTISGNGTTFYYFNGTNWAASSDTYATASSASTIATNISTLVATMGTGTLQVKTFLHSDGVTACEISNVTITGQKY